MHWQSMPSFERSHLQNCSKNNFKECKMLFCLHYNIISNTFLIINLLNQQVSVPSKVYSFYQSLPYIQTCSLGVYSCTLDGEKVLRCSKPANARFCCCAVFRALLKSPRLKIWLMFFQQRGEKGTKNLWWSSWNLR